MGHTRGTRAIVVANMSDDELIDMHEEIERLRAENRTLRNFLDGIHHASGLALASEQPT